MGKDPAVLWYWGDWHGGTITFSRHLKGCYMDLLYAQFNNGRLSLDEIKTVLGADFSYWNTLQKKFEKDEAGLYYNERAEEEKIKRQKYTKSRRDNLDSIHNKSHMKPHMEDVNEDRNRIINDSLLRWNDFAKQNNLSQVMKITDKRKSAILSRNAEPEFNLDAIFEQIKKSAFLLGETTSWKVDFDFVFCSRNNYIKILEGKYDGTIKQHTSKGSVQSRLDYKFDPSKVSKRDEELRKQGFD